MLLKLLLLLQHHEGIAIVARLLGVRSRVLAQLLKLLLALKLLLPVQVYHERRLLHFVEQIHVMESEHLKVPERTE